MKTQNYYRNCSKIAKALSHPSRLLVLDELSRGKRCVCELTKMIGADQTTVSKHLNVLKNVGLIQSQKKGLYVFYELRTPCLMQFFKCAETALKTKGPVVC